MEQNDQERIYNAPAYTESNIGYEDAFSVAGETFTELKEALKQEVVAKSFLYMVAALGVTAVAAFVSPVLMAEWLMRNQYNMYILFGLELVVVIASNWAMSRNNVVLSAVLFTVYAYLTGAVLGIVFWAYDLTSVGAVFFMTAGMFAVMAIYGLITKKDLSSVGNICMMGIMGVIIASVVNGLILRNGMFDLIISYVVIAIFVGLTAYDVQKIKQRVYSATDENVAVLALSGAFGLYLDFINIFLRLLRLFGKRK